jgi:hypothetical protein
LRHPCSVPIIWSMSDRGFHRVEDELGESWLQHWLEVGLQQLEAYLAKHAAFLNYLDTAEQA